MGGGGGGVVFYCLFLIQTFCVRLVSKLLPYMDPCTHSFIRVLSFMFFYWCFGSELGGWLDGWWLFLGFWWLYLGGRAMVRGCHSVVVVVVFFFVVSLSGTLILFFLMLNPSFILTLFRFLVDWLVGWLMFFSTQKESLFLKTGFELTLRWGCLGG